MNKKEILQFIILFGIFVFSLAACSKKHDDSHDEHASADASSGDSESWKEMDDFHVIMADAFHPYKDSSNLEPVKTHGEHLAMEAEKWASAPLPEKVNNDSVKTKLDKLKTETRVLADQVKAGKTDEEIAAQLTAVHNLFHEIQESWYKGGGDHH